MAAINPVSTLPASTNGTSAASSKLDKDGFLRLLVGQLRQQDPTNAKGTDELMSQMTQLSMLEQVTNLTKASETLNQRMGTSQALQLVGRTVSYEKADGTVAEGAVTKVGIDKKTGAATLTIGTDTGVDPAKVREIR